MDCGKDSSLVCHKTPFCKSYGLKTNKASAYVENDFVHIARMCYIADIDKFPELIQ